MKKSLHFWAIVAISSISLFFSTTTSCIAQAEYWNDVSGTAIRKGSSYADIQGTPYLFTEWMNGTINMKAKSVSAIPLKYNLEADELYFKDPKTKNELLFVDPVLNFTINEQLFENGYAKVDNNNEKSYYEVLNKGKVKLLKKVKKNIIEVTEYNGPKSKKFESVTNYYISVNNIPVKIKKDNSILSFLKDKESNVKEYLSKNKVNFKKDEDVIGLLDYYNSL